MLNEINRDGFNTHMPFIMADGATLLFCQSEKTDRERIWRLHYYREATGVQRLETGLSSEVIECSPTAWTDESGLHVSFIAGGARENPLFWLYQMDGASLDSLAKPVQIVPARCGFARQNRIVHGNMKDFVYVTDANVSTPIEIPNAFLYRVAYVTDAPDVLLISGEFENKSSVFSLRYDLATGEQSLIECDGVSAYKCSVLGERILYAEKCGDDFEDRRIHEATTTQFTPTEIVRLSSEAGSDALDYSLALGSTSTTETCSECAKSAKRLREFLKSR